MKHVYESRNSTLGMIIYIYLDNVQYTNKGISCAMHKHMKAGCVSRRIEVGMQQDL